MISKNWQAIEAEILSRIQSRYWKPGELIPNETELAKEFGCARATVNRALRQIADNGLLDRRRKSGTRVATHPVRKATLRIPIIRQEIEQRNHDYSYMVFSSEIEKPPLHIAANLKLNTETHALHHQSVHLADGRPYVASDRWVNIEAVPQIVDVDMSTIIPEVIFHCLPSRRMPQWLNGLMPDRARHFSSLTAQPGIQIRLLRASG